MFYLFPSICAFLCVALILSLLDKYEIGNKLFLSPQTIRHNSERKLIRIGGLIVGFIVFIVLVIHNSFVFDKRTITLFVGAFAFMFVGFLDDIKSLSWKIQISLQSLIVFFVIFSGINLPFISNPFGGVIFFESGVLYYIGILILVFWIIGIVNVLNWSDGMHGIFGGISAIASITIGILSLREDVFQPPVALISFVLTGALIGFLIIHLFGKKIIIGTAGTNFIGYIIAVLALFAGAKIGTALLVLIVPIVDAVYVLFFRFKNKVSLFRADNSHFHHRLFAIGWSKTKILLVYYFLTFIGSLLALLTQSMNKFIVLLTYGFVLLSAFAFFTKVAYDFKKVDRN